MGSLILANQVPYMDPDLYKAASQGNFDSFHNHLDHLDLLLTPRNSTILHVYIIAQTKRNLSNDSPVQTQQNPSTRHLFVEQVIYHCPSLLTKPNIKGETPLHIAAKYGHGDIIEVLAGHDNLRTTGQAHGTRTQTNVISSNLWRMTSITDETALHGAARNKHLLVVRLLIERDPALMYMCNDAGESPLYMAVERGHQDVASEILKRCFSSAAYDGPSKRTVLHAAVIRQDPVMTERILEKTGELTRRVDKEGWTPLHYASYFASMKLVEILLKYDKFAAYIQDIDGRTPLLVAASRRRGSSGQILSAKVMKLIISECPDCSVLVDSNGRNVLHLAAETFNDPAMSALLEAPCLFDLINEKDIEGNTPFHVLAIVGFNCEHLVRHRLTDSMVVNKKDLTAVDFIKASEFEDRIEKVELTQSIRLVDKLWGSWRQKMQMEPLEKVKGRIDNMIEEYKKAKESHLIMATLIATVTFAAAFTLPGGYKDDDPDEGYAVLRERSAFKVFLVADCITLAISMSVIFVHFLLAVQGHRRKFFWLYLLTFKILPCALLTMTLAGLAGIYAALPNSYPMAFLNIGIAAGAVIICYTISQLSFSQYHLKDEDLPILGKFWDSLSVDCLTRWTLRFRSIRNDKVFAREKRSSQGYFKEMVSFTSSNK